MLPVEPKVDCKPVIAFGNPIAEAQKAGVALAEACGRLILRPLCMCATFRSAAAAGS